MMRAGKRERVILMSLLLGVFLLLGGCMFKPAEELYAVPRASNEFVNLQATIEAARGTAEAISPLAGSNTQPVQMVDLDGDGIQEAVTFFRDSSSEKPLKLYIFHQTGEERYEAGTVIEGDGAAIDSIGYFDLNGDTKKEIVVSWRMSTSVRTLAAYRLDDGGATELMRTGYTHYMAIDMDRNNSSELLLIQVDVAAGNSRVEYYDYKDDAMALCCFAPLSQEITGVRSYRFGYLREYVPALFVLSEYAGNGVITDIFCVKDGAIYNVTLDEETGRSGGALRFYTSVDPTDINGDSILELPQPQPIKVYNKTTTADDYWMIHWKQYDSDGVAWPVSTTYHNYNAYDRWYLTLPDSWQGKFTLARRETAVGSGERAMVFSYWLGDDSVAPQPFLVIYKLSGSNRATLAARGNRFVLRTESDAIYAAEFIECAWDCGLDEEGVRERFDLIRTDWSAEG